ncbi:unnamed protein product [Amoebophrya sp. A25]|nr:unnamed protein product [Amoebophrya sp. A25]|eukprot:GSA25T00008172001.1
MYVAGAVCNRVFLPQPYAPHIRLLQVSFGMLLVVFISDELQILFEIFREVSRTEDLGGTGSPGTRNQKLQPIQMVTFFVLSLDRVPSMVYLWRAMQEVRRHSEDEDDEHEQTEARRPGGGFFTTRAPRYNANNGKNETGDQRRREEVQKGEDDDTLTHYGAIGNSPV